MKKRLSKRLQKFFARRIPYWVAIALVTTTVIHNPDLPVVSGLYH